MLFCFQFALKLAANHVSFDDSKLSCRVTVAGVPVEFPSSEVREEVGGARLELRHFGTARMMPGIVHLRYDGSRLDTSLHSFDRAQAAHA